VLASFLPCRRLFFIHGLVMDGAGTASRRHAERREKRCAGAARGAGGCGHASLASSLQAALEDMGHHNAVAAISALEETVQCALPTPEAGDMHAA
jgi:hypothetical protein